MKTKMKGHGKRDVKEAGASAEADRETAEQHHLAQIDQHGYGAPLCDCETCRRYRSILEMDGDELMDRWFAAVGIPSAFIDERVPAVEGADPMHHYVIRVPREELDAQATRLSQKATFDLMPEGLEWERITRAAWAINQDWSKRERQAIEDFILTIRYNIADVVPVPEYATCRCGCSVRDHADRGARRCFNKRVCNCTGFQQG